jgi:hypothetical protein
LTIHLVQQMDLGNGLDVAAVKLACDLSEGASAAGRVTSPSVGQEVKQQPANPAS